MSLNYKLHNSPYNDDLNINVYSKVYENLNEKRSDRYEFILPYVFVEKKFKDFNFKTISYYKKNNTNQDIILNKNDLLYTAPEKGTVIQHFKDHTTAFNNQKKSIIEGKGILNNRISEHILSNLNQIGIETHLIKRINMREQLVKLVEIIPIEFIIRNIATGSLTKRLGIEDGTILNKPLIEFCYKNDELNDPLVAREHIQAFGWANDLEINFIIKQCFRINDFMQGMFKSINIKLVDFKLEFGRSNQNGEKKNFTSR